MAPAPALAAVLATAPAFENLPKAVAKFRLNGQMPSFGANTLEQPFKGGQCLVFQLVFVDGTAWAARVPIHLPAAAASTITAAENKLLRQLEASGFPWSPRFVGEELGLDNAVGFPFTVYKWVPGERLRWDDDFPVGRNEREKVLRQLARMLVDSVIYTGTEREEPGGENQGARLTRMADNRIVRICCGQLPGLRVRDCFYHRELLPRVLDNELDNAPHFIGHGDLAAQNIIVDDDFNITGIIDWSFAAHEPFQLAARVPRILQDQNAPYSKHYDWKTFLEGLMDEANITTQRKSVCQLFLRYYSQPDLDFREQVLEAAVSKGAFESLAKTFPEEVTVDMDLKIKQFMGGKVGVGSGLRREDLEQYL